MDGLLPLLLRSIRALGLQGIRVDLVLEVLVINPATGEPVAFKTVMDERAGQINYDIRDSRCRVGDIFFAGQKPDGKLVAFQFEPRLIELRVSQPAHDAPETAPGIDVDAPPTDDGQTS